MKKVFLLLIVLVLFASTALADNFFGIYSNITTPLLATSSKGPAARSGISGNFSILWGIFGLGSTGIDQAVKNGRVEEIMYVDQNTKSYLFGLVTTQETIVYGR